MAEKLKGAGKRAAAGKAASSGKGKTDAKKSAKDTKAQVAQQTALEQAAAKNAEGSAQPGFVFGFIEPNKIGRLSDKLEDIAADTASMARLRGQIGANTKAIEEELGLDRRGVKAAQKVAEMEEQERTAWLSAFYIALQALSMPVEIIYRNGSLANASKLATQVAGNGADAPPQAANGNGENKPEETKAEIKAAEREGFKAGKGAKLGLLQNPHDFEVKPGSYDAWKQGWHRGQAENGKGITATDDAGAESTAVH